MDWIDLVGASARDYDGRWRRTQEMEEKHLEEFCIQLETFDFASSQISNPNKGILKRMYFCAGLVNECEFDLQGINQNESPENLLGSKTFGELVGTPLFFQSAATPA